MLNPTKCITISCRSQPPSFAASFSVWPVGLACPCFANFSIIFQHAFKQNQLYTKKIHAKHVWNPMSITSTSGRWVLEFGIVWLCVRQLLYNALHISTSFSLLLQTSPSDSHISCIGQTTLHNNVPLQKPNETRNQRPNAYMLWKSTKSSWRHGTQPRKQEFNTA